MHVFNIFNKYLLWTHVGHSFKVVNLAHEKFLNPKFVKMNVKCSLDKGNIPVKFDYMAMLLPHGADFCKICS